MTFKGGEPPDGPEWFHFPWKRPVLFYNAVMKTRSKVNIST